MSLFKYYINIDMQNRLFKISLGTGIGGISLILYNKLLNKNSFDSFNPFK